MRTSLHRWCCLARDHLVFVHDHAERGPAAGLHNVVAHYPLYLGSKPSRSSSQPAPGGRSRWGRAGHCPAGVMGWTGSRSAPARWLAGSRRGSRGGRAVSPGMRQAGRPVQRRLVCRSCCVLLRCKSQAVGRRSPQQAVMRQCVILWSSGVTLARQRLRPGGSAGNPRSAP